MVNAPFFRKRLLAWYRVHKRDLPWRRTRDPYAIFVSEMMLQQTQVATVVPFFRRFVSTLPHWKALAGAREDLVLKLWEGLGYYRRARNLMRAARLVVKPFGGKLPDTEGAVLLLPGVGEYSAGALLSIAYGKPFALVDGNVLRVYARVFRLEGNLKGSAGKRRVWDLARRMLDKRLPGDFNQALMELGATLCTPVAPRCPHCPVAPFCRALRAGDPESYPRTLKRKRAVRVFMAASLCVRNSRVLIRKRPKDARWLSGMWEFPSAEAGTMKEAKERLSDELGRPLEARPVTAMEHTITHHRIHLGLYRVPSVRGLAGRWVSMRELERFPFSAAQGRLRARVLSNAKTRRSAGP